jgi:glycosyltransferase involved in cell wall biosynthesis
MTPSTHPDGVRLKILHLIPALIQGGAEKLLFDLVSHSRGVMDMQVLTLLAERPFFQLDSAYVQTLGMQRGQLSLRALRDLRQKVKGFGPDVIHAWLYHGNLFSLAAAGLGVPIVWSIHNTTLLAATSKPLTRLANRICARLSNRVPARIVYCATTAREVHERIGYDPSRGVVIRNGVDIGLFKFNPQARERLRQEMGLSAQDYAVGCVGRFDPQKNHFMAIEAFSELFRDVPARLVLAGRGCSPDNDLLRQWLKRFGVEDHTDLQGERHDIAALMSAFDVLVIASEYGEAMPLVAIEAAAVGLPIVTMDVGDTGTLVLDQADIVRPASSAALAAALRDVRSRLTQPELQRRKAARRVTIERDFSLDATSAQYQDLYRSLARSQ